MKVAVGSDHGGYTLKEQIKTFLSDKNIEFVDLGTDSNQSVDYPDFGKKVGLEVVKGDVDFGIVFCGTGIGISIAANKVKGIRAALVYDTETARLAKEHNNANIIALGGRTTSFEAAKEIIESYLNASFEPRHQHRINKIAKMEGKLEDE
jgi:ribose 5-phosphate isomerase B